MLANGLGQLDLPQPIRRHFEPVEPTFATDLRALVRRASSALGMAWRGRSCSRRHWSMNPRDRSLFLRRLFLVFDPNSLGLQFKFRILKGTVLLLRRLWYRNPGCGVPFGLFPRKSASQGPDRRLLGSKSSQRRNIRVSNRTEDSVLPGCNENSTRLLKISEGKQSERGLSGILKLPCD